MKPCTPRGERIGERRASAYAVGLREALERIASHGPWDVNGYRCCKTCHCCWGGNSKFQSEHHHDTCAYVIAGAALAKNPGPTKASLTDVASGVSGAVGLGPSPKVGIVFRCCKECGSAEDVAIGTTVCPGCGAKYPTV